MSGLHVIIVAGECVPYAKAGGLADVIGALPLALEKLGLSVTVVIPRHRIIDLPRFGFDPCPVPGEGRVPVGFESISYDIYRSMMPHSSVEVFLVGNDRFFDRDGIYVDVSTGKDYPDQADRWIFFQRAVMDFFQTASPSPDILHCHDHQTGLIPAYLRKIYRSQRKYAGTRSVFTIHNMGYPGLFPREVMTRSGFNEAEFYPTSPFEFYGMLNFMKVGITYADLITTVSRTYACEIQQSKEYGYGLEGVLRERSGDLIGILNGIDDQLWNPENDRLIPVPYTVSDLSGKLENKKALLREFEVDGSHLEWPVVAMISRIDVQKGFDLVMSILDYLLSKNLYFVLLGTGNKETEVYLVPHAVALRAMRPEPDVQLAVWHRPDCPLDRWSGRHSLRIRSIDRSGDGILLQRLSSPAVQGRHRSRASVVAQPPPVAPADAEWHAARFQLERIRDKVCRSLRMPDKERA
ncbi:MAG: glycogen synthase [Acidobacteria bacterium]|nr:MAG: glycogen synthase [Acidobacteriota bacterium]